MTFYDGIGNNWRTDVCYFFKPNRCGSIPQLSFESIKLAWASIIFCLFLLLVQILLDLSKLFWNGSNFLTYLVQSHEWKKNVFGLVQNVLNLSNKLCNLDAQNSWSYWRTRHNLHWKKNLLVNSLFSLKWEMRRRGVQNLTNIN